MDNVGIVVESLDSAIAFFTDIGLKLEGRATIEGEWAGRVTGLGTQFRRDCNDGYAGWPQPARNFKISLPACYIRSP
jgi:catechol 2,3-dioxygenase-like lactoylglutathione lyase family enzyme